MSESAFSTPFVLRLGGVTIRGLLNEIQDGSVRRLVASSSERVGNLPRLPNLPSIEELHFLCVRKAAEEIIAQGMPGVGRHVLCSVILSREIDRVCGPQGVGAPRTTALNHLLSSLGYTRRPKVMKWRGKLHTVWTRGVVADVHAALDSTLTT